jgi:hypothetical protein
MIVGLVSDGIAEFEVIIIVRISSCGVKVMKGSLVCLRILLGLI